MVHEPMSNILSLIFKLNHEKIIKLFRIKDFMHIKKKRGWFNYNKL